MKCTTREGSIPAYAGETVSDRWRHPPTKVDPRVCGGNRRSRPCRAPATGRSPRMRGKRASASTARMAARSIPAYAGETRAARDRSGGARVDPRVCGGNRGTRTPISSAGGRSPRMRGKLVWSPYRDHLERSIPAYAGETSNAVSDSKTMTVDPRVCGGNPRSACKSCVSAGRSPRMRGKLIEVGDSVRKRRSIPAYAGETRRAVRQGLEQGVDPRVCGGNPRRRPARSRAVGRSPRMRGKRCAHGAGLHRSGSIPAYAGETHDQQEPSDLLRVDPRVCGGNGRNLGELLAHHGRSPRMRGKRATQRCCPARARSIPAYAGETREHGQAAEDYAVDPRVCGGNYRDAACTTRRIGRSPRMRGKRSGHGCCCSKKGSIPAYAGETATALT